MYAHWGADDLSDKEAASAAREAVHDLDRDVPVTSGWRFIHDRQEGGAE